MKIVEYPGCHLSAFYVAIKRKDGGMRYQQAKPTQQLVQQPPTRPPTAASMLHPSIKYFTSKMVLIGSVLI